MREIIGKTLSICPRCFKRIPATLYEEDGKVYMEKTCPEHGKFKDLYWSDAQLYREFNRYEYIGSVEVTHTKREKGCPYDCGLCPNHKTTTILANIDLTNRCNLNCPICFANAGKTGVIYERCRLGPHIRRRYQRSCSRRRAEKCHQQRNHEGCAGFPESLRP